MMQRDDPRALVDAIRVRSMYKQDMEQSRSFLSRIHLYVFSSSSRIEYFKDELCARHFQLKSWKLFRFVHDIESSYTFINSV